MTRSPTPRSVPAVRRQFLGTLGGLLPDSLRRRETGHDLWKQITPEAIGLNS